MLHLQLFIGDEPAELQAGIHPKYHDIIIPDAVSSSLKTNTANVVLQLVRGDFYAFRFSVMRFLERIHTTSTVQSPGLYLRFQLQGSQRIQLSSSKKIHLRQEHYFVRWVTDGSTDSRLDPYRDYRTVDIYVSPEILEEFTHSFPELRRLFADAHDSIIGKGNCFTQPAMYQVIQDILYCELDKGTRQLYYDLKIRELLAHVLHHVYERRVAMITLSPWELHRLHSLRDIMKEYISQKTVSLPVLAIRANMKQGRLREGFHQVFGCSVLQYLVDLKMKEAKELLLLTDKPLKEIGQLVGYSRTSNFNTAFKRKFGYTPASLRR